MALNMEADGVAITAVADETLLQAGLQAGLEIPYFCWHPSLGAVGSCRQCAVKVFDGPEDSTGRIVMACMTAPADGLRFSVVDPQAARFRAAVVEMVLTNHPHDCPVCEVGGECHLQDMTVLTGHHQRRYNFPKRTHLNQNLGPFIRHEMNRCIGCYRCVRFYRDYAGGEDFGVFGSARNIYFGRERDGALENPFAGNLVEVCPTGVFVDKIFSARFRRKWDLRSIPSVCPHCAVGCNITLQERGGQLRRVMNRFNATLNGDFICDRGRFGPGFVNSDARLRTTRDRAGNAVSDVRERLASLLARGDVIGIGSPRASIESNFALRDAVGAANFYGGFSPFDAAAVRMALDIFQTMRPARLPEIEQADGFLVIGDDPVSIAPRLALSLRQAARGPATGRAFADPASWLGPVTRPDGCGDIFAEIIGATARGHIASALLSARHPVIVAGGGADKFAAAANIVRALRRAGVAARLSLLLPHANSVGLGLLDARGLPDAAGRDVIVLERDLEAAFAAAARSITVLDSVVTPAVARADLAISVASFAESDGIFVNLEGRVQPFFKAVFGAADPQLSWQLLCTPGTSHPELLARLGTAVPALAACTLAWPRAGQARPPSLPHRHSGRTAADAHRTVREPAPPHHAESPFGMTMESTLLAPPPQRALAPWAPGWNSSAQAGHRAPRRADDVFLFQDSLLEEGFYDIQDSPPRQLQDGDELGNLSPAIIARRQAT
jgi:NADH-quinone oxidoreductase subunit G